MDKYLCDSLLYYFNHVSRTGFISNVDIFKLIFLDACNDFTKHDFRGIFTEKDGREIEKAMYAVFGTSCLTPYI